MPWTIECENPVPKELLQVRPGIFPLKNYRIACSGFYFCSLTPPPPPPPVKMLTTAQMFLSTVLLWFLVTLMTKRFDKFREIIVSVKIIMHFMGEWFRSQLPWQFPATDRYWLIICVAGPCDRPVFVFCRPLFLLTGVDLVLTTIPTNTRYPLSTTEFMFLNCYFRLS